MRPSNYHRRIAQLLIVNLIVIGLVVLWNRGQAQESVQLAVAKSQAFLDMPAAVAGYPAGYVLDVAAIEQMALSDKTLQATIAGKDTEFVSAVRLTAGEARYWQDQGCDRLNCAFVTLYDYSEQGTIEAIVNVDSGQVIGHWTNAAARPGGTSQILPKAVDIAAADPQVRAILGADIGAADPTMIPMSGWLMDNACREEWCVDLTFHDPSGTGRIFHVFVNLEQEIVARTFYTRARADRSAAKPLAQRDAFTDGCHDQYGWSVCWEMTANDGINFRDATYNGQLIFSSAKIGQIEAWYPSWPGGYRDEIGFAATVPPFGGTLINDLGDGYEVGQIFTEFTRWPNCICCYRYEQVLRFFSDGRFELRFISHGPGCDDISIYRPFWRVDIDLDGPENDQVWLFEEAQWREMAEEFETFPVVEALSPEGHKLATFDGDLHYRWSMARTDPLGLDEGYLFLLQHRDLEGDGPITTGPGDTFIPPRQWIDGDALSGENVVLWHVPLLKTKKGGPWWCMPDPDPDFSPCEAILRADPAGEIRQPTAEEAAALLAQSAATPTPGAPTPSPAPTATPRPIDGRAPDEIIQNAGCGSCHKIGAIGEAHKVGPDLTYIGLTAGERVTGMTAEEYIHQSIVEPNAYLAPECPNTSCLPGIMPQNFATRLSAEQIDTMVAFLLAQQGPAPTPVPIGGELAAATAAPKAVGAGKVAPLPAATTLPSATIGIILIVLVAAVSLVLIWKNRS
ncbi:c-type cytochrome [Candidatus Promineifilum breve]|uniref:c-type cytochrome n=1 Tax=Candidatus Promineifilum breve TaxID=1806508 RepID=UPI000BA24796|nr:c-type cytochrome [Candidatus Promineifilum breve]